MSGVYRVEHDGNVCWFDERSDLAAYLMEHFEIELPAAQVEHRCFGQIGHVKWGWEPESDRPLTLAEVPEPFRSDPRMAEAYLRGYNESRLTATDDPPACEGHESLRGDSMGISVTCDGSCVD